MKYHNCLIIKTKMDLGESNEKLNYIYKIYRNSLYMNCALTLSSAKNYIDSGFNPIYL